jgi:hypothetical protein
MVDHAHFRAAESAFIGANPIYSKMTLSDHAAYARRAACYRHEPCCGG